VGLTRSTTMTSSDSNFLNENDKNGASIMVKKINRIIRYIASLFLILGLGAHICVVIALECRTKFRPHHVERQRSHPIHRHRQRSVSQIQQTNCEGEDDVTHNEKRKAYEDGDALLGTNIAVSYDGESCHIIVLPNESILSALERQSIQVQSHLTSLPDTPSDCRRGNCMTCAALVKNPSTTNLNERLLIRMDENGLSPAMSELITEQGYVLTCSSFLRDHEADTSMHSVSVLELELGVQNDIWNEIYANRFTTPETQLIARAAMARVLRQAAERNPQEWLTSTEKVLRQTELE
jgi:ferredoxin